MRVATGKWPDWLVRLLVVLATWAFVALVVVLTVASSAASMRWWDWALLLVLGPPAYVAVEWAAEKLSIPRLGARISSARLSLLRIAVALAAALVFLVPFVWWSLSHRR